MPSAGTHHPVRAVNLRTYKPLDHQHIPEITQTLADAGAKDVVIRFVPVSAPLSRGIFATCFAHVPENTTRRRGSCTLHGHVRARAVRARPREAPARGGRRERHELRRGRRPGRPDGAEPGKRVVACFAATDNLIKGGAGQAIQSMNIMLGVDERTSLEDPGGWP